MSGPTKEDLRHIAHVTNAVLEAATPHLVRIASAASGNRTYAVGDLLTSEPANVRDYRKELWIGIATGVAVAPCKSHDTPAQWANHVLNAFDERFKEGGE